MIIKSPFFAKIRRMEIEEKKAYSLLIFSLLAVSFFGLFAIRPAFLSLIALNTQLNRLKTMDKNLSTKIVQLSEAKNNFEEISLDLGLLEKAIPKERGEPSFLNDISFKVAENKFSLIKLELEKPDSSGIEGISVLPVKITLEGEYKNVEDVLFSIQKSPRLINIVDADIKHIASNISENDLISLVISGNIYFYEDTNVPVDDAKNLDEIVPTVDMPEVFL